MLTAVLAALVGAISGAFSAASLARALARRRELIDGRVALKGLQHELRRAAKDIEAFAEQRTWWPTFSAPEFTAWQTQRSAIEPVLGQTLNQVADAIERVEVLNDEASHARRPTASGQPPERLPMAEQFVDTILGESQDGHRRGGIRAKLRAAADALDGPIDALRGADREPLIRIRPTSVAIAAVAVVALLGAGTIAAYLISPSRPLSAQTAAAALAGFLPDEQFVSCQARRTGRSWVCDALYGFAPGSDDDAGLERYAVEYAGEVVADDSPGRTSGSGVAFASTADLDPISRANLRRLGVNDISDGDHVAKLTKVGVSEHRRERGDERRPATGAARDDVLMTAAVNDTNDAGVVALDEPGKPFWSTVRRSIFGR